MRGQRIHQTKGGKKALRLRDPDRDKDQHTKETPCGVSRQGRLRQQRTRHAIQKASLLTKEKSDKEHAVWNASQTTKLGHVEGTTSHKKPRNTT